MLACLVDDPRWDQLDNRDDYLARLVLVLGIDIGTIAELLRTYRTRTPEKERKSVPLVLEVLGRLSQLGNAEATEYLRREAAGGDYRGDAAEWLAENEQPPDDDRVEDEVDLSGWTTEQLLAGRPSLPPWPLDRELRTRTSPDDVRSMLRAAGDPASPTQASAIQALAHQGRTELFPTLLTFPAEIEPGRLRRAVARAFVDLPFAVTRDAALDWLQDGSPWRRRVATRALARHASEDEVPIIREMLAGELERGSGGHQYLVCDLAEALARSPKVGPFPELRQAYREMVYSFGRRFVVEAMAATDPDFPSDLAFECLWDCNEQIREVAASQVAVELPGATERLRALSEDQYEDAPVRAAAAARLGLPGEAVGA